ncbi:MAG: aminotransferase class I/II-fold pyridoxal phosphate-dependent enzyme, partial [Maribacter dokdonensis]
IITLPPTYGMYKVLSGINLVENREVLLTTAFQPNIAEITKAIDEHTKLLFICSPNNPTGNSFSTAIIEELLNCFNGLVVIDEAYIDFSSEESWASKLADYPNLIVTQTLSKAYGMAGIRLGLCLASAEIIAVINKIKPPYNVNQLTQDKAIERVSDQKAVQTEVASILEEREKVLETLKTISFVSTIYPTDANFILAKVDDATLRYTQLLEKGIVVRNRTTQPLCENTLRFTVGTSEENNIVITALRALSN